MALDSLVAGAVEEAPRSAPPASPASGACYLVSDAPTGAWAGKAQCVAVYTSGGIRFIDPVEGMTTLVRSTGTFACFRGGAWEIGTLKGDKVVVGDQQVLGQRSAAIAVPAGGTTVDVECRNALEKILLAMRGHGLIET